MTRMRRQERLKVLAGKLEALSPLAILGRGYSICWSLPGRHVVKAATEVRVGSEVAVRLHHGELRCLVQGAAAVTPAEG
jgi:exodeoxyribonuclease VII large subunit